MTRWHSSNYAGMRLVKACADTAPVTIVNSINPYRLQGQKTAAFEIVDALGRPVDETETR